MLIRGYIQLYRGYSMHLLTTEDVFLAFSAPGMTMGVKIPQTIRQIDKFGCILTCQTTAGLLKYRP